MFEVFGDEDSLGATFVVVESTIEHFLDSGMLEEAARDVGVRWILQIVISRVTVWNRRHTR